MNHFHIVFFLIFIIIFIIYNFIRLKYGFWFYQPVFHVYDFKYYFFPCGIIQKGLPIKNKFINFVNIKTHSSLESSSRPFLNLLNSHYHNNEKNQNKYILEEKDFNSHFKSHNNSCFFSTYSLFPSNKIIGIMTSRPFTLFFGEKEKESMNIYYVDYLCVDKAYRKKNIAPQLIQTHEYVQRHAKPDCPVSLFKKEGELTGIVPLCVYDSVCFKCLSWSPIISTLKIIVCDKKNIHLFNDFLKNCNEFTIIIQTHIGNMLELIQSGNLFIYMLQKEGDDSILAVYIFKLSGMWMEEGQQIITCIGSFFNKNTNNLSTFINGFQIILNKYFINSFYIVIENISFNHLLIQDMKKRIKPFLISPSAYFFYNFAYPTVSSQKVLVIG